MTQFFDPDFFESHDLYHARYGLGAVIVAIPKDPDPATADRHRRRGLHTARLFTRSSQGAFDFEPVLAVEQQSGFVRMTLEVEYRRPSNRDHVLPSAVIERVVPVDGVTLEAIHARER